MPTHWLGLLIVGLFAGVLSGMFGIGGGVVIVPALVVFLGFTTVEATSTSLGALLLPVGILAVLAYRRSGLIRIRDSALIALGLIITTAVGAQGALELQAINPDLLRRLYGLFLLYVGWRFVQPRQIVAERRAQRMVAAAGADEDTSATVATDDDPETTVNPDVPWYTILGVGLVAGVASGLFGIGGGAVIVPALTAILHYDPKLAVGTSLGALLPPVGLPGVLVYLNEGVLDIPIAAIVAVGLMVGAIFGARIALGLPSRTVKRLYGGFLLLVALRFILA